MESKLSYTEGNVDRGGVRSGKEQTMSKYIDVEWLKQNFNTVFWSQITKTIDSAPSIDIVRCGECKHWCKGDEVYGICYRCPNTRQMKADDFCSYGERSGE